MLFLTLIMLSACNAYCGDNTQIKELLSYDPALITISNRFPEPLIVEIDSTGLNTTVPKTQLAYPQAPEKQSHTIPPNTENSLRFWKLIHKKPHSTTLLSTLWIHIYISPKNPSGEEKDYCGAGS